MRARSPLAGTVDEAVPAARHAFAARRRTEFSSLKEPLLSSLKEPLLSRVEPGDFFGVWFPWVKNVLSVAREGAVLINSFEGNVGTLVVAVLCARLSSRSFRVRLHPISIPS
jgi:hypothetical protein